jgi:hypothetical protein
MNGRLVALAEWVGDALEHQDARWLITELIRLVTFTKLRIRHTCCDPRLIRHHGNPQLHISPYPRYQPDELEIIVEEDRELVELLEELIVKYDELYDTKSPWSFLPAWVEEELILRLDEELGRLKKDDIKKFTAGRQQMGIVMEVGSSEDESSETSEDEDASEDDAYYDDDEEPI